MQRYTLIFKPETAFATSIKGDTLFGQACWLIRQYQGESHLTQLLTGYTEQQPFMVVSDAQPCGYIKRPIVPLTLLGFDISEPTQRKKLKAKNWLPETLLTQPMNTWHTAALSEKEMLQQMGIEGELSKTDNQSHNSLNRKTGTTGSSDGFAPFQRAITWYHPDVLLSLQIEIDETRFSAEQCHEVFNLLGMQGYGKEASCGLGKFSVIKLEKNTCVQPKNANALLTLAPTIPQGQVWQADHCYYQTFTRFGRHGDRAIHSQNLFKNPILMADSYALLTPEKMPTQTWCGQGVTGVSKAIPTTVQQGYAPVYQINRG